MSEYETFKSDWEAEICRLENAAVKTQKQAEEFAVEQTSDDLKTFQHLAKHNLFFLADTIMGFNRLSTNLHGHLCGWMKDTQNERFREILLPRGHFKSTVATVAHSLQLTLPDLTNGAENWIDALGPEIRLVIAHETHTTSMRFLFAITQHYLGNPWIRALFPDHIPNRKEHKINLAELELPRRGRWPEPTIDTMSVGARGQGRHYNYLKLDDLIGDKARDSETEMAGAIQWFNNIQSFFSNFSQDKFDLVGTRWAMNDLYEHVHKTYGAKLAKYIRPVWERNADGELIPIFPEEFTPELLEILQKDAIVWNAQYLNDPTTGTREFLEEWKRYFSFGRSHREIVVRDPARDSEHAMLNSRVVHPYMTLHTPVNPPEVISVDELDVCILVDPAMSGESGIVVTGMDKRRRVFILDSIKEAMKTPQFLDVLFALVRKWNPRVVVIEEVLFSGLYADFLPTEMVARGLKFHIERCRTKNVEKDARVRQLTNYFSNGQIFAPENFWNFWEEYDFFGTGKKYHLLDSLAQGPSYWLPGNRMAALSNIREKEREILAGRSIVTGYSRR